MNVYDFDGTIYDGDSSADFFLYCAVRHPRVLTKVFTQIKGFYLYFRGRIDKTALKEHFFSFLQSLPDVDADVAAFWDKNLHRIKRWYLERQRADDVVISASPLFLVKPVCERINISGVMASDVDRTSGRFLAPNCHGRQKAVLFRQRYPDAAVAEFYSDSLSDAPLAALAAKAYLVKKQSVKEWDRQ